MLEGDDKTIGKQIQQALDRLQKGMVGKKLLLKWK